MKKNILVSVITALLVSLVSIGSFQYFHKNASRKITIEHIDSVPVHGALYTKNPTGEYVSLDFTKVSEKVMDAVVHIKSKQSIAKARHHAVDPFKELFGNDFFDQFFAPRYKYDEQEDGNISIGAGSGVIINSNGYIVTNNHVIANADEIEVTLHNNKSYQAKVIGTDPSTDLALLQIKAENLTSIPLVNSDAIKIGDWVLAVGNPFNLNSTVTAGIVSAKSRNINILRDRYAIESFIQTDAAINPGNSGGALVNLQGGLIGINTAIASPTGSYTGYGFAIPANIVSKVVEDLLKFGVVQRGFLGITISSLDSKLAAEKGIELSQGVLVDSVLENSAAENAGIKPNDVILKIQGTKVTTSSELQEIIGRHRPGDELLVLANRDGKEKLFKVSLNNKQGNKEPMTKNQHELFNVLGAEFEEIEPELAKKLKIAGGVKVKKLLPGKLRRYTDIKEGFIVTKIDKQEIHALKDLMKILENKKGGVMFEGIYEKIPGVYYYAFGM